MAEGGAPMLEFSQAVQGLNTNIERLVTNVTAQGLAQRIKNFDGSDPKKYREWVKEIEKYGKLNAIAPGTFTNVAFMTSSGPVSDFLTRYQETNPLATWHATKAELGAHFGDINDPAHALSLLRRIRQREGENVQVFCERLLNLADDAYAGCDNTQPVIQKQLVSVFTDGLTQTNIKYKLMRENPETLHRAVEIALAEQNLRKRFQLRTGLSNEYGNEETPMEVDHYRIRRVKDSKVCYKCNRKGHLARECRAQVNVVNANNRQNVVCWNCGGKGHFKRECKQLN